MTIKIGTRYVYYQTTKTGDWQRLPCVVVGGPFYRKSRWAFWEIQVDGESKTRFVSSPGLVDVTDDATGIRRYQAIRDRHLGGPDGGVAVDG